MQIPGKYNMADIAQRLSEFMKEKQYEAGECLTEVVTGFQSASKTRVLLCIFGIALHAALQSCMLKDLHTDLRWDCRWVRIRIASTSLRRAQ